MTSSKGDGATPDASDQTPAPGPNRLRRDPIRAEQVRILYEHTGISLVVGNVAAAALVALYFWGRVPGWQIVLWLAAILTATVLYARLVHGYKTAHPPADEAEKWGMKDAVYSGVTAALWSGGFLLFFDPGHTFSTILLAILAIGHAWGPIAFMANYLPSYYAHSTLFLLPLSIRFLAEGSETVGIVGLFGLLALVAGILFARIAHRIWRESIALRFENRALVDALTQQKDKERRARIEAQRANIAKSKFVAAASHDLRQPLYSLGLFVEALDRRVDSKEALPLVDNIRASVASMKSLFNALMDLSEIESGGTTARIEPFPVEPLLERLVADYGPMAAEKGLPLTMAGCGVLVIESDPVLLERILRNLISNAIRYTDEGRIVVGCRRSRHIVRIEVHDTGQGIREDDCRAIFDEFAQLGNAQRDREQGIGLGLAIVDKLARLLGHDVKVSSQVGRGSCFSIAVPLAADREPGGARGRPPAP